MKKIKWGIAILCLLLLAAIILPLLWGLRSVLLPIRQTVDMLRDIAEGDGDLTRRLDIVRQDEVGELAWNFNEFIDKLQSLIAQVADNTVVLESAAVKMTGIAGRVDDVARDNSERVKNVAVSMEQMSDSFSSVADLTEQSSGSISMVGTASEELTATIGELEQKAEMASEVCEEARSKTGDTSIQMAKLGDAAQAIGKVLETISEISEQVNLLALNATIEAARAGDAGKGFAVVANEIKELAKQTAEATVEIRENIENIQSRTELTVREIAEIAEVNSHVSEIVSGIAISVGEQSSATREIAENISRVSHNVMEVNESVGQNSSVAEEVAGDISEVQEKVHTLVGSSRELNGSVEELNQVTVELNTVVGKFKI
jgi:methyl-accepting chemotaxis protein